MQNILVRHSFTLSLGLGLALAACGDQAKSDLDASVPAEFVPPTPFAVPLSDKGPDQLQSATAAPGGKFYAAGFAAATLTGPRFITVVKYSATGPDSTFGSGGVVTTTVDFKGGNDEVDIVTQPDGKIVVSATVAASTNAADRDIAVIRLLDTGALDTSFDGDGIATISLNTAFDSGTALVGPDAARGLTASATGIFVHASSRGLAVAGGAPRTDTDFTVVKLTPAGQVDTTFGKDGQFRLDIGLASGAPRGIKVLDDGKLLVSGYSNTLGTGENQPVLFKLTAAGELDTSFAAQGLFHEIVLAAQTEVYNFAVHGTKFVTAGYGRNALTAKTDYVSLRFDLATGARDEAWGGASNGAVFFDPSGAMLGSNCRNAVALPGGKTLLVGSTGAGNMPEQDAIFVVLDANGVLDTSYGTGIQKFVLGANGNDQFWGGAVSGDLVTVVGYKGGGVAAQQTDAMNDDAYGAVFTLR